MSWRSIAIVYRKELLDSLRDRRTLISMILVPVLLMPALMFGVGAVAVQQVRKIDRQTLKIMILGADNAPKLSGELKALSGIDVVPPSGDYTNLISARKVRAAVEFPPAFEEELAGGGTARVTVYEYQGEIKSSRAARRLQDFFNDLRDKTIEQRLEAEGLDPEFVRPLRVTRRNVAPPEKVTGNSVGSFLPYIVILMSMIGAMYPAMDLTAGEKERGTMETLLCSPVKRSALVGGKFLVVVTASLATATLSLSSLGFSFLAAKKLILGLGSGPAQDFPLALSMGSVFWVLVMLAPVAVLLSAGQLCLSLFARNFKEAQTYLSPLMIVVILPAMGGLLPGAEIDANLALVPVLNASLMAKEIFGGQFHWGLMALTFGSTCVYAFVALGLAVMLFNRESVLFRA